MSQSMTDATTLRILERLDHWRLPADADVEGIVLALTTTPIERQPITSTCLRAAGYDEPSTVLELQFTAGHLHRYLGVPVELWRAFLAASSKGRFYRGVLLGRFIGARVEHERVGAALDCKGCGVVEAVDLAAPAHDRAQQAKRWIAAHAKCPPRR